MFKILDRYIIRKFLGTFLFSIGLIVIIVVIFDYVERVDDFIETKATFRGIVVEYYLNFVPYFVNQFTALFTFIAVIFFTSKLAYQSEIIAMLSGGMSFRRLMWPYFVSAFVITAMSLVLSLFVIPPANAKRLDFEERHRRKNLNMQVDYHIYRQVSPGVFVYIQGYRQADNTAQFFALQQYEGNRMVSSLAAARPTFDPATRRWSAPQHITRTFEGDVERFERHEQLDTMINLDAIEFGRIEKLVEAMPIGQLNRFIREQKEKGSQHIATFEVERAQRYSNPFSIFILTLIGVSLSSRKVRGGTGLHIGVGITLCFTYILFARFAQEFAKGGAMDPTFAVWLPNIIFAVVAIYLYRRAPK
ncbi:MAG: LptF/LptG family permease [Rikenellaceae bacterium]|nr:LptF/LptG family permease [Rikenellaceae bacterium]MCL2693051.1 LptF/LptG family permease [Rikenellaceae bacterium]